MSQEKQDDRIPDLEQTNAQKWFKGDDENWTFGRSVDAPPPDNAYILYPLTYLYFAGGLYYYSGACCTGVTANWHYGDVVSNMEINTPLNCNTNGIIEPTLNVGLNNIPNGAGQTRQGLSLGVYPQEGGTIIPPSPAFFQFSIPVGSPAQLNDFRDYGNNPVAVKKRNLLVMGNNQACIVKMVTGLGAPFLIGHPVSVPDATQLPNTLTVQMFDAPTPSGLVIRPLLATVAKDVSTESYDLLMVRFY